MFFPFMVCFTENWCLSLLKRSCYIPFMVCFTEYWCLSPLKRSCYIPFMVCFTENWCLSLLKRSCYNPFMVCFTENWCLSPLKRSCYIPFMVCFTENWCLSPLKWWSSRRSEVSPTWRVSQSVQRGGWSIESIPDWKSAHCPCWRGESNIFDNFTHKLGGTLYQTRPPEKKALFKIHISQPKHVVGAQKNRLTETVLLSTQNIC